MRHNGMEESYQRIASFLSEYVLFNSGPVPPDAISIAESISVMIRRNILTKEEMITEALAEYDVIIPDWLFMDPVELEEMLNGKNEPY